MILSLCACGSVNIGPLTFHFGDSVPVNGNTGVADGDTAIVAPPVEEIAPVDNTFAFEDFSMTSRGSFLGDFTPRGYNPSYNSDGLALFLFFVFDYTEYIGNNSSNDEITYITEVVIDGISYPVLDVNLHENHFINNIDRYFGYDYAAPTKGLEAGESKTMIACFEIPEEARAAIHSGINPIYCVHGTYIECTGYTDIFFIEETFNVASDPEFALSDAQLRWSLDMSYYLLNYMMLSAEVYGGTGTFDDYCTNTMFKMFSNGYAFSPAVAPDFNGYFTMDSIGMHGMIPEIALEEYDGEVMGLFFEYREYCLMLADMAMTQGMTDEFFAQCEYAMSLYFMILSHLGMEPYEYYIEEV